MNNLPLVLANAPAAASAINRARNISGNPFARYAYDNAGELYSAATKIASGIRGYRARRQARNMRMRNKRKRTTNEDRKPAPVYSAYPEHQRGHFDISHEPNAFGFEGLVQKTLKLNYISMPSIGNGTSLRLSNCIDLRGVHFCISMFNDKPFPVEVHFAFCQFGSDTLTTEGLRSNFFRADTNDATSLDFQNYSTAAGWDHRYLCNPLNPENKRILHHRKFLLGRKESGKGLYETGYYHKHDVYIPINRKMYLENSTDGRPEKPFVWFMWVLPIDSNDHDTTASSTHIRFNLKRKMYFKNVI